MPASAIDSMHSACHPATGALALSVRIGPPTLDLSEATGATERLRLRVRASLRDEPLVDDTYQVRHDEVHRELELSPGLLVRGDEATCTPITPT